MGEQDDGLGLSLSLGCAKSALPLNLNLVEAPSRSRESPGQKSSWHEIFYSPGENRFFGFALIFLFVAFSNVTFCYLV